MASKVLISSASPVVLNKAAPSNRFSTGLLGQHNVTFSAPSLASKKANSRGSLVARAQQQPGGGQYGQYGQYGVPTNPVPVPVHASWTTTEDDRWFKFRLDMPGVAAEDIDVKVEGDFLVIKDLGRQLYSPYDTKLQLPAYCVKHNVSANLENGVLHIFVPKITTTLPNVAHVPVIHVPIKHALI